MFTTELSRRLIRPIVALVALTSLCSLIGCGGNGGNNNNDDDDDPDPPIVPVPQELLLALELVASGLTAPVSLTHAGDGTGRLFICDQAGQIRIIDSAGNLLATPFLDVTANMVAVNPGFDERGLLGLAFHPDFADNGRFFVRYSRPRVGMVGEPCDGTSRGCHREVLSEFNVGGNPLTTNVADAATEIELFSIDEPQFNHNGGHVAFGPDGLLYFSLGDGGGANDGLSDMPSSHGPGGNGQDLTTALGKILRIDVDSPTSPGLSYAIPADNPFVGTLGAAPEIYALGMRNPYRFSFDDRTGGNGALFVADVGQNLFEEIDIVVRGGNYGWVTREGFICFDPFNPGTPLATCATTGMRGEPLIDPVLAYGHDVGLAVVGGYVYRGAAIPALQGRYVFGDFSVDFGPTGKLFIMDLTGDDAFELQTLPLAAGMSFEQFLFGFGQDEDGEIYVLASDNLAPVGNTGVVYRIVSAP